MEVDLALGRLIRNIAHDFNNVWARILGLSQQATELASANDKDRLLERIGALSSSGLLYTKNILDIVSHTGSHAEMFDVCATTRLWAHSSNSILAESCDISCLIPSYPIVVRFDRDALSLILLSLLGLALRTSEDRCWSMLGVRSARETEGGEGDPADGVDIILVCGLPRPFSNSAEAIARRMDSIKTLATHYGGSAKASTILGIGLNVRIRLPVVRTSDSEAIRSDAIPREA